VLRPSEAVKYAVCSGRVQQGKPERHNQQHCGGAEQVGELASHAENIRLGEGRRAFPCSRRLYAEQQFRSQETVRSAIRGYGETLPGIGVWRGADSVVRCGVRHYQRADGEGWRLRCAKLEDGCKLQKGFAVSVRPALRLYLRL